MTLDRSLCTLATCSVEEYGWYSYIPNIGANATFLVIFSVFAIVQLYLAIKYKKHSATPDVFSKQGHGDGIFEKKYFVIQLVCLTIAPALISAPIYLSLGRIVKVYGTPFSLLASRTYAIIFVWSDLVSLILQAFGGALAAIGKTQHKVGLGVHILVAGLAFQVLSLLVFMAPATHLWSRVRKGRHPTNSRFDALCHSRGFRLFIWAIAAATVTIQIRCIYRVVELADDFRSGAANDQYAFMVLDGPMIMIAVGALTLCHPGPIFFREWTRLGSDSGFPNPEEPTLEIRASPKHESV